MPAFTTRAFPFVSRKYTRPSALNGEAQPEAGSRFDLVVTLCDRVREICPELPGEPVTAHWSLADPAAAPGATDDETYPAFVRTADELEARVDVLLAQLAHRSQEQHQRRRRAPR